MTACPRYILSFKDLDFTIAVIIDNTITDGVGNFSGRPFKLIEWTKILLSRYKVGSLYPCGFDITCNIDSYLDFKGDLGDNVVETYKE